jgi:hypothetical protein
VNRDYTPLCLKDKDEYLSMLAACPTRVSDYSFANLWGWCEEYGLEWSFGNSHAWIRQTLPQPVYWAPVGPWDRVDWSRCPTLTQGGTFIRVPERLAAIWSAALPGRVEVIETREHWDYVYSIEELTKLSGNRFHKKKNLLSQFVKTYDFDFRPLTADCIEEVLEMQMEWSMWREAEGDATLRAENRAISRVVKDWDRLSNLLGGAIRIDGRVIAYTVAEALDDSMLVIHFEKGHTGFKGVYQAINQMFLTSQGQGHQFVNREQDLGDEGLRKAKMSYNPVDFLKKCTVNIKS